MVERTYECPRCHAKAIVRVPSNTAKAEARDADADRSLRLARCPMCHERPLHAIPFAALRIGVIALGAAIATWMIGATMMGMRYDALEQLWAIEPIVILGVAGWLGSVTLRRWRATSSIEIVRMIEATSGTAMPKAIVVEKKPVVVELPPAPPPPVAPITTRAPDPIAPASSEDGPRFLK